MELLDPKEFIITRKRKKYKFALFHNSPLCFEFDEWDKQTHADVVEIGAGNAHFLVELASRHPEQQFVALDVKADRLQSVFCALEPIKLSNCLPYTHFRKSGSPLVTHFHVSEVLGAARVTRTSSKNTPRDYVPREACL